MKAPLLADCERPEAGSLASVFERSKALIKGDSSSLARADVMENNGWWALVSETRTNL